MFIKLIKYVEDTLEDFTVFEQEEVRITNFLNDFQTSINRLIIIDLIPKTNGDLQTATNIGQKVADDAFRSIGRNDFVAFTKILNRPMLIKLLNDIALTANKDSHITLHIEAHGDPKKGILISDSDSYITWEEIIAFLTKINSKCQNKLGIVLSMCHGASLLGALKITDPCPFEFCISSENSISAGFIDDNFPLFYKTLLTEKQFLKAMAHLQPEFKLCTSYGYFYSRFIHFLYANSSGKAKQKFIEEIVSLHIKNMQHHPNSIKAARKHAKEYDSDFEIHFNRMSKIFLHERNSINFKDLHDFVKEMKNNKNVLRAFNRVCGLTENKSKALN